MHKRCLSACFLGTADSSAGVEKLMLLLQVLGGEGECSGAAFLGAGWSSWIFICDREEQEGFLSPPLHTLQCLWILRGFLPNTAGWDFLHQLSVTSVTHLLTVGFGGVVSFSEVLCVVSVVLCHL